MDICLKWGMALVGVLAGVSLSAETVARVKCPVDYVNPMIGASTSTAAAKSSHGLGKTFPGVTTPFGLVQLSPDTLTGGDNGSGYSYHHPTIEGFSFTHMSGVGWYGDLGNFLVTPTVGELKPWRGTEDNPDSGYRSRYSHSTETARADYYAVTLDDYNIRVELAAAPRSGMLRFTYPETDSAKIQIDLARRIGGTSVEQSVEVLDNYSIQGWMKCTPAGGGWGDGGGNADYTVYFYCVFQKPLEEYGIWSAVIPDTADRRNVSNRNPEYAEYIRQADVVDRPKTARGKHLGFFVEFKTKKDEQVLMKCGISFVSMAGARSNLEMDIKGWDFENVTARARNLWEKSLDVMTVSGGSEKDRTVFYTALYHTLIDPRCFADVDGSYVGADKQIHKNKKFIYRTIFSGWDVFRSQFPLQTLINPDIVNDEVNSLIQMAELSGRQYYPRWEFLNAYSGCMIGNPAVSVILDAYVKGIRGYDTAKAFEYAKNSVDKFGNGVRGYTAGSLSHTLEYAYTDWCVGRWYELTGDSVHAVEYYQKSLAYKNVWCKDVKWFRSRLGDGSWMKWRGRTGQNQGTVESNPFQQGWFVPHDIGGLQMLMGKAQFDEDLNLFFNQTPENFFWNDYYNHPNEPNHHAPFLFNYSSTPWLTQKWTRKICTDAYGDDVLGLCGNEDVGQMSAWYILAAAGFHPICPGSDRYELSSPLFNKIVIRLDRQYYAGKTFTIETVNNSPENVYIQSVTLNGKLLNRLWITHREITDGGCLQFEMGKDPNRAIPPNVPLPLMCY